MSREIPVQASFRWIKESSLFSLFQNSLSPEIKSLKNTLQKATFPWECNWKFNFGHRLPQFTPVWGEQDVFGSHCLDQLEHWRGFYPLVLSAYSGRSGWMWVNDQASLPADKCLLLDLEQIVDVSTAQIGKAPPLTGSISSFQMKNFLEVNDTTCCGQGRSFYHLPVEQLSYLIFQAFNLFNLALRGWSFCCWSQWQFCDRLEWSLSQDQNYL